MVCMSCGIAAQVGPEGVLDMRGMHGGDLRADAGAAGGWGLSRDTVGASTEGPSYVNFLACSLSTSVHASEVEIEVTSFNELVSWVLSFFANGNLRKTRNQLHSSSPGIPLFNVSYKYGDSIHSGRLL